jgi:HEAT repeat protein
MDACQSNSPKRLLPAQPLARPELLQQRLRAGRLIHFAAMMAGVGLALAVSIAGGPIALWAKISSPSSPQSNSVLASATYSDLDLDRERPQKQAVILLERAVSRSDETDQTEAQIEARVDAWRGKLEWDSQLGDLTTVALNSRDQRLRSSAIEVQLAAYGLPKSESSVDALVRQAGSCDHTKKIWALWMLGLLGNRGVATERVVQVLTAQLKDSKDSETGDNKKDGDEDARRWAVQGLALVGTTPTIAPLLDAMHNDPSAAVRERAASSLAESAMLSQDQRLIAVPQLINYSGDPALDTQTHALAFQALAAITKQHLPNDPATWRNWYQTSEVSGQ